MAGPSLFKMISDLPPCGQIQQMCVFISFIALHSIADYVCLLGTVHRASVFLYTPAFLLPHWLFFLLSTLCWCLLLLYVSHTCCFSELSTYPLFSLRDFCPLPLHSESSRWLLQKMIITDTFCQALFLVLHILTHLILTPTLRGMYYYLHFTNEKTRGVERLNNMAKATFSK